MIVKSILTVLYNNVKDIIIYVLTPPLLLKDEMSNSNKKLVNDEIIGSNKEPLLNNII